MEEKNEEQKKTYCGDVRNCWLGISRMYNAQAVKYSLTTTIGFVLLNIHKEGTPATHIAPSLGMEPRSLTRILKNMEEMKLIYRQPDEKDKRMVRIFLTEEGKKKRDISRETVLKFNNMVRENVGERKLKDFIETIDKINKVASLIKEQNMQLAADEKLKMEFENRK